MIRIILWGVFAAGIVGLLGTVVYKIDQSGYKRCEVRYEAADAEQKAEAAVAITKIRNEYEKRLEEVYETPDSDNGPVAPVLERTLDGMRERHGN